MVKLADNTPYFAMQTIGRRDEQEDSYGICYEFNSQNSPIPNCRLIIGKNNIIGPYVVIGNDAQHPNSNNN